MDLQKYNNRKVRVVVSDDPGGLDDPAFRDDPDIPDYSPCIRSLGDGTMEITAMASSYPREYGELEFNRDEESILICIYQIFESDIKEIELVTNVVDDYISVQDPKIQPDLNAVRAVIADTIPDAEEKISYGMPTWWRGHNLIHFAAQKHHIGLYPGPEAVEHFAHVLDHKGFKYSKGAVQIPYDKVELDLVEMIAEYCAREGKKSSSAGTVR